MPKVSIFIPVYNTEKYIDQSIKSVINQTYSDWELIVLDDCSTDNTFEIINSYKKKDQRIKIYRNKENLGMMPNWIEGIKLCSGEYWGKLDADDYWEPTMIEDSINILKKHNDVGLVCSKYKILNEKEEISYPEDIPSFLKNKNINCEKLIKSGIDTMFKYNILRQGIGLMRFSVFKDLGTFTLLDSADTEMWFRIGTEYKIFCLDKILHTHRLWSDSFMRNNADNNNDRKEQNLFNTRKAILDYYLIKEKINRKEYYTFSNENLFRYNSYLIYKNRIKKKYIKMFKYLSQNFFLDPQKTFIENIHINRTFSL